ncbi:hypothetical protein L1887_00926 [Cichorium endivia]|nr:hypothetical protein L1887_00926 [Cichorium endivia]
MSCVMLLVVFRCFDIKFLKPFLCGQLIGLSPFLLIMSKFSITFYAFEHNGMGAFIGSGISMSKLGKIIGDGIDEIRS